MVQFSLVLINKSYTSHYVYKDYKLIEVAFYGLRLHVMQYKSLLCESVVVGVNEAE